MKTKAQTLQDIFNQVPEDRKEAFLKLHEVIVSHLPPGFEAAISYGGLGYVVPHALYPAGYHCKPSEPLPFAGIASRKHSINLYHMGLYASPALYDWFVSEYKKRYHRAPDIGKSCIRFKKSEEIPYPLIGELMQKMRVSEWIDIYEQQFKKSSKK